MTTSDAGLLDSNVLIYSHQGLSKFHSSARNLVSKGIRGELLLCITPQVLGEFYAVITSPNRVTSPISPEQARIEVEAYVKAKNILKIYPNEDSLTFTVGLLNMYSVKEQDIFDLQLVATMLSNGVARIYTYNKADFAKYREIEVLSPESVLQ
jgi:hypothetical protein